VPIKFKRQSLWEEIRDNSLESYEPQIDLQEAQRVSSRADRLMNQLPQLAAEPELIHQWASEQTTDQQMFSTAFDFYGTAALEHDAQILSMLSPEEQWARWSTLNTTAQDRLSAVGYRPVVPDDAGGFDEGGDEGNFFTKAAAGGLGALGAAAGFPLDKAQWALGGLLELGAKSSRLTMHSLRTVEYIDELDKMEDESLLSKMDFSIGFLIANPKALATGWRETEIERESFRIKERMEVEDQFEGNQQSIRYAELFAAGYGPEQLIQKLKDDGYDAFNSTDYSVFQNAVTDLYSWAAEPENQAAIDKLANNHQSFGEYVVRESPGGILWTGNPDEGLGKLVSGALNFTAEWVLDPALFVGGGIKGMRAARWASNAGDEISHVRNARNLALLARGDDVEDLQTMLRTVKAARLEEAPDLLSKTLGRVAINERTMRRQGEAYLRHATNVVEGFDESNDGYKLAQLIRDSPELLPAIQPMLDWDRKQRAAFALNDQVRALDSVEGVFDFYESTAGLKAITTTRLGGTVPAFTHVPHMTTKQAAIVRTRKFWNDTIDWGRLDVNPELGREMDDALRKIFDDGGGMDELLNWRANFDEIVANTSRTSRVGRSVVQKPARLAAMFRAKVPLNRGYIPIAGDDAIEEFGKFMEFGVAQNISRAHMDDLTETFIRGTAGERDALIQTVNQSLFRRGGLIDPQKLDEHGQHFAKKFLNYTKHQYGVAGYDGINDGLVATRAALWDKQSSVLRAIPDFDGLMSATRQANFLRRARFNPRYGAVESLMNRVWRPAQLMTFSFIMRAGGEESLTFALREGPMAFMHSQVFAQWAADARLGRRSLAWKLKPEVTARLTDEIQNPVLLRNALEEAMGKGGNLIPDQVMRETIAISEELAVMRPMLYVSNSIRNSRYVNTSMASIKTRAFHRVLDLGIDPTDIEAINREMKLATSVVRQSMWESGIISRNSIRLDEMAQRLSRGMAGALHGAAESTHFMTKQKFGRGMLHMSSIPAARKLELAHRHMLNEATTQRAFAEMNTNTFSPFEYLNRNRALERTAIKADRTAPGGIAHIRMRASGDFALFGSQDADDLTDFYFAYGSHLDTAIQDPLMLAITTELHHVRTPIMQAHLDDQMGIVGASTEVPAALHRTRTNDLYRQFLRSENDEILDAMLKAAPGDDIIPKLVEKLRADIPLDPRTRFALDVDNLDEIRLVNQNEWATLRHQMVDRQIRRMHDPRNRGFVEKMQRTQMVDGKPVTRGLQDGMQPVYTPMNHASNLGYLRDIWDPTRGPERLETFKDILTSKLALRGIKPDDAERILESVAPIVDDAMGVDDLMLMARTQVGANDMNFVNFTPFATTDPKLAQAVSEAFDETFIAFGKDPATITQGVRGYQEIPIEAIETRDGVRWSGQFWKDNDFFQLEPQRGVHTRAMNEYDMKSIIKWEKGEQRRWVEEGKEAVALGDNFDDLGWRPTDNFVTDRGSFEEAVERMASDQVDEVFAMIGARSDPQHGPMTEITHHLVHEGSAPRADDIVRLGNKNDLPAHVPGPRMVSSEEIWWDKMVSGFFEGVADPAMMAMSRAPVYRWNYANALEDTQHVRTAFRDPKMRAKMEAMAKQRGLDMEWFDEEFVERVWRNKDSLENANDPLFQLARAIDEQRPDKARELFNKIHGEGAIDNVAEEIFQAKVDNLRFDQGFSQGVQKRLRLEARAEAEEALKGMTGRRFSWTDNDIDFIGRWARQEATAYDEFLAATSRRATELTIPFIDDHRLRSQFQQYVGNLIPFWYAEEQFLRRMARTMLQSPEALRKGQIMMNGLRDTGVIVPDQFGGEVFVIPNWLPVQDPINAAWNVLFGSDPAFLQGNTLMGSTEYALPGYNDEFGHFQFGPMFEIPMSTITQNFPEFEPTNARWQSGDERANDRSRGISEMLLPTFARNAWSAINDDMDGDRIKANAIFMAMQVSMANGTMPDEDASPADKQRWRDDLRAQARVIAATNVMLKFTMPGGIRQIPSELAPGGEGYNFVEEVTGLTEAGLSYPDALSAIMLKYSGEDENGVWQNPQLLGYNVFRTEVPSGARVEETHQTYEWLRGHQDLVSDYKASLAWVLPVQDPDEDPSPFDRQARQLLLANELRKDRNFEEVEVELYLMTSRPEFYRTREQYDKLIFELRDQRDNSDRSGRDVLQEQINDLEDEKRAWSDQYLEMHPVLKDEYRDPDSQIRRDQQIAAMRRMVQDPRLGENPTVQAIQPLVARFQNYEDQYEAASDMGQREAAMWRDEMRFEFLAWADNYAAVNPLAKNFYENVIRYSVQGDKTDQYDYEQRIGTYQESGS
jgi:hypothetical protein